MRPTVIVLVCGCYLSQTTPPVAADSSKELAPILKKAAARKSYHFTVEERPDSPGRLEASYQKGQPLACKTGRTELFKRGKVVVYRDAGRWLKSRTGRLSDPLRVLGAVAQVRTVRLPHEELAILAKSIRAVKKSARKEGGLTIYTATLDAGAARALARTEHQGVAQSGTVRLAVNGDGSLVKYTLRIRVQGRLGNAEIDGTDSKTVALSGLGTTKVEVPKEARKALE